MSDYEDTTPEIFLPSGISNGVFWGVWDTIKNHRFKLKWGIFRPSFKLVVLEPLIVKLLGPRPPA